MLFEAIKAALESVPALADKVFPLSVVIDDTPPPFAVYTFGEQTAVTDLNGAVHHYTDEIIIDFWAETYDQAHELFRAAEAALRAAANSDDGCGEYIFGVACGSQDSDAAESSLGLQIRRMVATVQWCDL